MLISCWLQGKLNSGKSHACGARYLAAEKQWNVSSCLPCEAFCLVLTNVFPQAVLWPNEGMKDLLRLNIDCRHGPQSMSEMLLLLTPGIAPLYVGCCFW